jgi:hypothetical protein
VERYLEPLLEAVRRNFPGSSPYLVIEEDPEVEDLRHLVILGRHRYEDVASVLAARDAYYRDLFAIVPAPLVCEFRLGLEWSE